MSDLIVHGGSPLKGRIHPSANKNAVLPILAATLLTREPVRLQRLPEITDARRLLDVFRAMGSRVEADLDSGVVEIEHRDTAFDVRGMRLPQAMRSSILLVPPLLTRFGCARIEDEVRGCTLGVREIDPHIEVFEHFGARNERGDDGWVLTVKRPLQAVNHWLDYASVTTTENFVLCAALAQGRSTLTNAACEPHVQEFCRFLISLGARIDGVGTSTLSVTGVGNLGGGEHRFDEDFHEITTFLALSAITGGDVQVKNPVPEQFPLIDRTFAKLGAFVTHERGWSRVVVEGGAGRELAEASGVEGLAHGVEGRDDLGRGHRVADAEPGQTMDLGERAQHYDRGAARHELDSVRVVRFGLRELEVGLVEHDQDAVGQAAQERVELAAHVPGTGRVVGVGDEQQPRPGVAGLAHRGEVPRGQALERPPSRLGLQQAPDRVDLLQISQA